jgi:hypothetical protein
MSEHAEDTLAHTLDLMLSSLAAKRRERERRGEQVRCLREAFDAQIKADLREWEQAKKEAADLEAEVRSVALLLHAKTGTTKPATGVSVVQTKAYRIDEAAGLAWARVHRMCLVPEQLDRKAVEKMCQVVPLPFVEIDTVAAVRIATNLDGEAL